MGSERDGGREAIQNRYPAAVKRPAGRNAADLSASHLRSDRLVVGSHERLAGLEASSVHWTLWQCRERFNCVFAMRNQTQKPPCATPPRTCPARVPASTALVVDRHKRLAGLAALSVALDVAAMSLVFQLRVCSAHSIMIAVLHVVFSILSELSCLSRAVRAW